MRMACDGPQTAGQAERAAIQKTISKAPVNSLYSKVTLKVNQLSLRKIGTMGTIQWSG